MAFCSSCQKGREDVKKTEQHIGKTNFQSAGSCWPKEHLLQASLRIGLCTHFYKIIPLERSLKELIETAIFPPIPTNLLHLASLVSKYLVLACVACCLRLEVACCLCCYYCCIVAVGQQQQQRLRDRLVSASNILIRSKQ